MMAEFKVRKRTLDTLAICDENGQWWIKEGPTNRSHKGQRCIYPNGPPLCQEGYCEACNIPLLAEKEIGWIEPETKQEVTGVASDEVAEMG